MLATVRRWLLSYTHAQCSHRLEPQRRRWSRSYSSWQERTLSHACSVLGLIFTEVSTSEATVTIQEVMHRALFHPLSETEISFGLTLYLSTYFKKTHLFLATNFNHLVAVMQTLLTSHRRNTYISLLSASDVRRFEGRGEKFLKGLTDRSCCSTCLHPQQKIAALQGVHVTRDERRDLQSCLEYGL